MSIFNAPRYQSVPYYGVAKDRFEQSAPARDFSLINTVDKVDTIIGYLKSADGINNINFVENNGMAAKHVVQSLDFKGNYGLRDKYINAIKTKRAGTELVCIGSTVFNSIYFGTDKLSNNANNGQWQSFNNLKKIYLDGDKKNDLIDAWTAYRATLGAGSTGGSSGGSSGATSAANSGGGAGATIPEIAKFVSAPADLPANFPFQLKDESFPDKKNLAKQQTAFMDGKLPEEIVKLWVYLLFTLLNYSGNGKNLNRTIANLLDDLNGPDLTMFNETEIGKYAADKTIQNGDGLISGVEYTKTNFKDKIIGFVSKDNWWLAAPPSGDDDDGSSSGGGGGGGGVFDATAFLDKLKTNDTTRTFFEITEQSIKDLINNVTVETTSPDIETPWTAINTLAETEPFATDFVDTKLQPEYTKLSGLIVQLRTVIEQKKVDAKKALVATKTAELQGLYNILNDIVPDKTNMTEVEKAINNLNIAIGAVRSNPDFDDNEFTVIFSSSETLLSAKGNALAAARGNTPKQRKLAEIGKLRESINNATLKLSGTVINYTKVDQSHFTDAINEAKTVDANVKAGLANPLDQEFQNDNDITGLILDVNTMVSNLADTISEKQRELTKEATDNKQKLFDQVIEKVKNLEKNSNDWKTYVKGRTIPTYNPTDTYYMNHIVEGNNVLYAIYLPGAEVRSDSFRYAWIAADKTFHLGKGGKYVPGWPPVPDGRLGAGAPPEHPDVSKIKGEIKALASIYDTFQQPTINTYTISLSEHAGNLAEEKSISAEIVKLTDNAIKATLNDLLQTQSNRLAAQFVKIEALETKAANDLNTAIDKANALPDKPASAGAKKDFQTAYVSLQAAIKVAINPFGLRTEAASAVLNVLKSKIDTIPDLKCGRIQKEMTVFISKLGDKTNAISKQYFLTTIEEAAKIEQEANDFEKDANFESLDRDIKDAFSVELRALTAAISTANNNVESWFPSSTVPNKSIVDIKLDKIKSSTEALQVQNVFSDPELFKVLSYYQSFTPALDLPAGISKGTAASTDDVKFLSEVMEPLISIYYSYK